MLCDKRVSELCVRTVYSCRLHLKVTVSPAAGEVQNVLFIMSMNNKRYQVVVAFGKSKWKTNAGLFNLELKNVLKDRSYKTNTNIHCD